MDFQRGGFFPSGAALPGNGGLKCGKGCRLRTFSYGLGRDAWDGVAGSQFVEGDESSGVVFAGVEG
jgi:hypothetical protein